MSQNLQKPSVTPRLVMGAEDHERLTSMAHGLADLDASNPAARLIGELERARVVPQSKLPRNAVRMGSTVSFSTSDGFDRTFQLVYPVDADIAQGRVSVLTPVGAALIGLHEGQTILWSTPDRRKLSLTVKRVVQDDDQ